jgi:hypothetical protein
MARRVHVRQVGGEWWVWDARRLLAAARELPVETVSLGHFDELDEEFWFRHPGTAPTARAVAEHAALIAAADLAEPVLLCPDGRLLDGMHRVCRAWLDGVADLPVRRFRFLPPPDYRGAEAEAFLAGQGAAG